MLVKNNQIRCDNCRKKYNTQHSTKLNKRNKITKIVEKYGIYHFNDDSLNKKIIELRILTNSDKINNIDSHDYKIKDLNALELNLEKAILDKKFKKST